MTSRSAFLDERVQTYVASTVRRDAVLDRLREETSHLTQAGMQIGGDQGQFMQFLVKLLDVRRYLEIGVFTGYSSLAVALALPEGGLVTACDVSDEWTSIGRRYWREAGVESRIDLRLAPALETLDGLIRDGASGTYDMAFIDADKANVDSYYERCLRLLRRGGVVLVDNVLWNGAVTDPSITDPDTAALRALNTKVRDDERVDQSLLTIGDGLLMARKR
ncbi:MAG TPA: class I SAM-dependent methyltransferase [Candidatus Baltobacteraceae bacterium]|nr:class I SAM-dependent methyltransferase [Candidatus Baltobacteraceae bacterium]